MRAGKKKIFFISLFLISTVIIYIFVISSPYTFSNYGSGKEASNTTNTNNTSSDNDSIVWAYSDSSEEMRKRWLPSHDFARMINPLLTRPGSFKPAYIYGPDNYYSIDFYPNYTCPYKPFFLYAIPGSSEAIDIAVRFLRNIGFDTNGLEIQVKYMAFPVSELHINSSGRYVVWRISFREPGMGGVLLSVFVDAHTGTIRRYIMNADLGEEYREAFLNHTSLGSLARRGYYDFSSTGELNVTIAALLGIAGVGNNSNIYGYFRYMPSLDDIYSSMVRAKNEGTNSSIDAYLVQYYNGFIVGYPFIIHSVPWWGSAIIISFEPHALREINVVAAPMGLYNLTKPDNVHVNISVLTVMLTSYFAEVFKQYNVSPDTFHVIKYMWGWYWYSDKEMKLVLYVGVIHEQSGFYEQLIYAVVDVDKNGVLDWCTYQVTMTTINGGIQWWP